MAACRIHLGVGATLSSSNGNGEGWRSSHTVPPDKRRVFMPSPGSSSVSSNVQSQPILMRRVAKALETASCRMVPVYADPALNERCYGDLQDIESETNSNSTTTSKPSLKCSRRHGISTALLSATSILLGQVLNPNPTLAEETAKKEEGGTFVDGVLELLDPDQVTKTGKKLPKKYVKSVREVVKNLRESFTQDSNDGAKFRRNADSAKEAIREYLQNWRGSKIVEAEDSYVALERAFRELGKFYSSKGPQAALPEDIRNRVLEDLNKADDSL